MPPVTVRPSRSVFSRARPFGSSVAPAPYIDLAALARWRCNRATRASMPPPPARRQLHGAASASRSVHLRPPRARRSTRAMKAGWAASQREQLGCRRSAPSPATAAAPHRVLRKGAGPGPTCRSETAAAPMPDGERRPLADAHLETVGQQALDARPLHPGQALDAACAARCRSSASVRAVAKPMASEHVAVQGVSGVPSADTGQAEAGKPR